MSNNYRESKEKILNILNKKNPKCLSCGSLDMTLIEGFSLLPIQEKSNSSILEATSTLPVVLVVCRNCGYVHQYAVKVLMDI